MSYADANQHCTDLGLELATITTSTEQNNVLSSSMVFKINHVLIDVHCS